jgi:hypothetical protein
VSEVRLVSLAERVIMSGVVEDILFPGDAR